MSSTAESSTEATVSLYRAICCVLERSLCCFKPNTPSSCQYFRFQFWFCSSTKYVSIQVTASWLHFGKHVHRHAQILKLKCLSFTAESLTEVCLNVVFTASCPIPHYRASTSSSSFGFAVVNTVQSRCDTCISGPLSFRLLLTPCWTGWWKFVGYAKKTNIAFCRNAAYT